MRNSLACMRLQRGRTLVINSMEAIAHVRKAAHRRDVVVALKVNHALTIAIEGGHVKMKWSILLLDAHPATAQLKEKMKQSLFLLEAHEATAQKKDEAELITYTLEAHSTNQEYCSCKKDCSSSHCGCVLKRKKCSSLFHGGKSCKNEAECINPIWVSELSFNLDDKNAILLGDWLTDKHTLLRTKYLKGDFHSVRD